MPEMSPIESSTIASVGYDPEQSELYVQFHKTGMYVYHGVSPETHRALMTASSPGRFLADFVKDAHGHRKL